MPSQERNIKPAIDPSRFTDQVSSLSRRAGEVLTEAQYMLRYLKTPEFNPDNIAVSRSRALRSFDETMRRHNIESGIALETRERIVTVFDHWEHPEEIKDQLAYGQSAFLVHERGSEFEDVANAFPALRGLPPEEIAILFKQFTPAFLVGLYFPKDQTGETGQIKPAGSVISLAVTVKAMEWEGLKNPKCPWKKVRGYMNKRIFAAVDMCHQWGASIVGLSETMGSSTSSGRLIEEKYADEQFPDRPVVTTGHAFTLIAIEETTRRSLEAVFGRKIEKADLAPFSITLVGGLGAIGIAWAELVTHMGFGRIVLEDLDRPGKRQAAAKLIPSLKKINPDLTVDIFYAQKGKERETIDNACQGSQVMGTAASTRRAVFTESKHALLLKEIISVEDSQPPMTLEELVKTHQLFSVHALAPAFLRRTFDTGLLKDCFKCESDADWGCSAEVNFLLRLQQLGGNPAGFATNREVTFEMMQQMKAKAIEIGLINPDSGEWCTLQSFGQPVSAKAVDRIRSHWKQQGLI